MASYHLSVKSTSRAKGQSSVAAAAYRSGERLLDERTGGVHDFSRKSGIEQKEIIAPSGAPEWVKNRERLWNAVEQSEKRKDAKVAREFEIALPSELSKNEQQALAREFAQTLADRYGVAVDMAIHRPHRKGDERNAHAHLLTTTRGIMTEGLGAKCRVLDSPKTSRAEVEQLRELWAKMQNQALERGGHEVRVDHRTLEAQGLDRPPQIHVGPHATAMERRGMVTDRGEINRAVIAVGKELAKITTMIREIEARELKPRIEVAPVQEPAVEKATQVEAELLQKWQKRLNRVTLQQAKEYEQIEQQYRVKEKETLRGKIQNAIKKSDGTTKNFEFKLFDEGVGFVAPTESTSEQYYDIKSHGNSWTSFLVIDRSIVPGEKYSGSEIGSEWTDIQKKLAIRKQEVQQKKMAKIKKEDDFIFSLGVESSGQCMLEKMKLDGVLKNLKSNIDILRDKEKLNKLNLSNPTFLQKLNPKWKKQQDAECRKIDQYISSLEKEVDAVASRKEKIERAEKILWDREDPERERERKRELAKVHEREEQRRLDEAKQRKLEQERQAKLELEFKRRQQKREQEQKQSQGKGLGD